MQRLQEPQLYDHKEQEKASGPSGDSKVLQHVPEAYRAQGSEVTPPAAQEWFCYIPEFTAKRRPVELIWSERCGALPAARRREKEIKGWSRAKKLSLAKAKIEEGDRRLALNLPKADEGSIESNSNPLARQGKPFEPAARVSQGKGE